MQSTELTHAAMLGLGVHRPERVVTNDEICEVLDSSDEWIQSRSGIRTRRFAGAGRDPHRHGDLARPRGAGRRRRGRGPGRLRHRRHLDPPRAHPASAPQVAPARVDGGGVRRLRRVRGLLPRAQPGGLDGPLGAEKHVLVIGVEQLSRFMDPTDRGTAFIFADGAGAVVVGPAERRASVRRPGAPTARRPTSSPRRRAACGTPRRPPGGARWRAPRSSAGRRSRWPRSRTRRSTSPGSRSTSSTPSSRTRPTCGSPRPSPRTSSSPSPSRSPPTSSTRATPRPPRCRSRWRRCSARARRRPATLALLIAFGAGLSYAGQVVTLPPHE